MSDTTEQHPDEIHQRFLADLKNSQPAVWRIAAWLTHRHHDVMMPGFPINNEGPDQWQKYADDGDLFIMRPDGKRGRVDVRHVSYDFIRAADWPHGDKFLIERVHRYDRKKPPPAMMFFVNPPMTHVALVRPRRSFAKWYVEERRSSLNPEKGLEKYYLCPMDLVEFMEIGT